MHKKIRRTINDKNLDYEIENFNQPEIERRVNFIRFNDKNLDYEIETIFGLLRIYLAFTINDKNLDYEIETC